MVAANPFVKRNICYWGFQESVFFECIIAPGKIKNINSFKLSLNGTLFNNLKILLRKYIEAGTNYNQLTNTVFHLDPSYNTITTFVTDTL